MQSDKYIYPYETQFTSSVAKIDSNTKISNANKRIIHDYVRDSKLKGHVELPTLIRYYSILGTIAEKYATNDFSKLQKIDFERIVEKVNNREELRIATKQKYWQILKKFGSWLAYGDKVFNENGLRSYPDTVAWLNTSIKSKNIPKIKSSDILTEDEIEKLIDGGASSRDKAFLSVLYETGSRISELGNIRIKDITEHEHGYFIDLASGKTGERNVIVVMSSARLSHWLNDHPNKDNKNSFVWVTILGNTGNKHRVGEKLGYNSLHKIVVRAKDKARIKKKVHPHLFRHSRVTHLLLNKQINEQQAKVYFGWSPSSKQLATYSHLTSSDVNNALLQISGAKPKEEIEQKERIKMCMVCKKPNNTKDKYCSFCYRPLDYKTLMEEDQKSNDSMAKLKQVIEVLAKDLDGKRKKEIMNVLNN